MKITLLALVVMGCLPAHLSKYSRTESKSKTPVSQIVGEKSSGPLAAKDSQAAPTAATVYAVDSQTYRFVLPKDEVWEGLLDVLLKNYNLNIVDKESGIITTEWDSFFLSQIVYRNKVSVRLRSGGRKSVDVIIHNNVEKLEQGTALSGVWLPSEDVANEPNRIAQNVALALNQPPPQAVPGTAIASPVFETDKVNR